MTPRRVPPRWKRLIEARLARLEERIAREIRAERHAREADGAHTDEEIEALSGRVEALLADQRQQHQRLSWLEKRQEPKGRPPRRGKN